jgi:hypothetical protein
LHGLGTGGVSFDLQISMRISSNGSFRTLEDIYTNRIASASLGSCGRIGSRDLMDALPESLGKNTVLRVPKAGSDNAAPTTFEMLTFQTDESAVRQLRFD